MGIKFNCPNGHKLNVKSFLAGKKGVCPHCGAKFRIPATPAEDDHDDGPALDVTVQPDPSTPAGGSSPTVAAANASQPAPNPSATPVGAMPVAGSPVGAVTIGSIPVGQAVPPGALPQAVIPGAPAVATVRPATPAAPVTGNVPAGAPVGHPVAVGAPVYGVVPPQGPGAPFDPIAENPAAVWYVRPPSGGQYGPARGDIMRKWIAEGRVTGTSLVWREGWPDWRNAAEALPGLGAPAATPVEAAITMITPAASRSTGRYVSGRKKSNALAITALVLLTILCLVMVGVLVVVLGGVQLGGSAATG